MGNIEGVPFQNSDTCSGVAYQVDGAPLDFSRITISGRYPETGWAMNKVSHEMVTLRRGAGRLILASEGAAELELDGQPMYVEAGRWFAWEGDMTVDMVCHPPFDPDQYNVIEVNASDEIILRVNQVLDKYFPEDKLFVEVEGMDEEDIINFLFTQLLNTGKDPEEILKRFGIIEEES